MRLGAAVGSFATLDFDLPVTLQVEGLYSMKGSVLEEGSDKITNAVHYIDINILAQYEAVENIHVLVGPSLGLMPGGKAEWEIGGESGTIDYKCEDFNGIDFGLIIGGGYSLALPFGDIVLEARYSLGLKDAYAYKDDAGKSVVQKIRNNVIQIMVGYAL